MIRATVLQPYISLRGLTVMGETAELSPANFRELEAAGMVVAADAPLAEPASVMAKNPIGPLPPGGQTGAENASLSLPEDQAPPQPILDLAEAAPDSLP